MNNPFNCGVYRWFNTVNGKSYVGSSANINKRKQEHLKGLTSNNHHSIKLQRAWNKYGENEQAQQKRSMSWTPERRTAQAYLMAELNCKRGKKEKAASAAA